MAVGNGQPGVEVSMAIPTTAALASQQSTAIQNAVTTGTLASEWGQLGTPQYPLLPPPLPPYKALVRLLLHNFNCGCYVWELYIGSAIPFTSTAVPFAAL